jgi:hypothetical protein
MSKSNVTIKTNNDSIVYIKGKDYIKGDVKEAKKWKNITEEGGIELYIYKDNTVEIKE